MIRWVPLLVAASLLIPGAVWASSGVKLDSRSARVGYVPLTVRFRATVDPDEHNRTVCIVWNGENYSGSGCQTMDGTESPVTFWRDVVFRRPGEYEVVAIVGRNDNKIVKSVPVVVTVLGMMHHETPE